MIDHETPPECNKDQVIATNSGRRRLIGTGAAAAPFLLTLVSQPALGVTCFTPSRSLSRNTSLSQQGHFGECTGAESPGNYAAQQTPGSGAYHWPASTPPGTLMHPLFTQGNSQGITKFRHPSGASMTLGEALNVNAPMQVHFHIIAALLNKRGGNGAVIPDSGITEAGIKAIWTEYAMTGYYTPFAGAPKWDGAAIVLYLKNNGIVL